MGEIAASVALCSLQPIWKACGQITPKSASERVCVLVCFYLCVCVRLRSKRGVNLKWIALTWLSEGFFFPRVLTRGWCPNRRPLSACLCARVCLKSKVVIIPDSNPSVVFVHITATFISGYIYPLFHTKCCPTSMFTLSEVNIPQWDFSFLLSWFAKWQVVLFSKHLNTGGFLKYLSEIITETGSSGFLSQVSHILWTVPLLNVWELCL